MVALDALLGLVVVSPNALVLPAAPPAEAVLEPGFVELPVIPAVWLLVGDEPVGAEAALTLLGAPPFMVAPFVVGPTFCVVVPALPVVVA